MLRVLILISVFFSVQAFAEEIKEVYWEDLMPEGFNTMEAPTVTHELSMTQLQPDAPLVYSFNGQTVKIPGFVVPLEGDEESVTEFLLVPYFGACIHVPPPPSNQIIYVKFDSGVPFDSLYDAIWVTGVLSTEGWKGDIASVGYNMQGADVEPFDG